MYPKTRQDIQRVILYAKARQKRIKVAGTKHSWNDVFIDDSQGSDEDSQGNILLCLLPESVTNPLLLAELLEDEDGKIDYDILFFDAIDREITEWGSELQNIQLMRKME